MDEEKRDSIAYQARYYFNNAFLRAQRKMSAAVKDSKNPHFKNTYADLSSVIDAVKGPLNDEDISFSQSPAFDIETHGSMTFVVTITRFTHKDGHTEAVVTKMPLKAGGNAQDAMSSCTYAKRYALQSYCGLPTEDDDGNVASGINGTKPVSVPTGVRPNSSVDANAPLPNEELNRLFKRCIGSIREATSLVRLKTIEDALVAIGFTASQIEEAKVNIVEQSAKIISKLNEGK